MPPVYPERWYCAELGHCDLHHKIWLIYGLFFYIFFLFLLMLSLCIWETLWARTPNTFMWSDVSFLLCNGRSHEKMGAWMSLKKQSIAASTTKRSCRQNATHPKAVSFSDLPDCPSYITHALGEGKVLMSFLAHTQAIPVQMLCSYPPDT